MTAYKNKMFRIGKLTIGFMVSKTDHQVGTYQSLSFALGWWTK